MKIQQVVTLARSSAYNDEVKQSFKSNAMAWIRKLAKDLALNKEHYDVRFNAGGIAVSGDAILHHDRFYLIIGESGVMWRTCKGRKDYTGGGNQWFVGFGGHGDRDKLMEEIRRVLA